MFLCSHFLWKLVVDGDLQGQQIAIFGKDFTGLFYKLSQQTTQCIYYFARLFPNTESLEINDTYLYFPDGGITLSIIWGCTGIKQAYIFFLIMLFCSGPWKKKLWYIPLGLGILWANNIIRVAAILYLTEGHPERFHFLHEGLFKWIYYGIIFLLWVYWEEVMKNKKKAYDDRKDATDN